ncbi:hypothetical protein [Mesorhizobium escarrei]|uniref:Uncharacterized protein n=1 Tax=Mesorhizobium escarrei TaxID=666018 RepID=A0ABM9DE38_9HYPH|nr:hypothetical protein [Mesorhizobium escarrei]CAH2394826.1 conserved hypothetical protein [Mesorhizobium escarrei]
MSRHYLFPNEGEPLRMSLRLVEGLIFGKDILPQYAGTKQRVLSATLEFDEAKKPTRILRTEASVWVFDQHGGIRQGLHEALALAMDILPTPARDDTVVELRPRTKKQKLEKEFRWEPGKAEIDRVISDIWPKRKADRLKAAEGVAKRKPPLTYDASRALDEASEGFWKIEHAIERLKEPSLKGFAFGARQRSEANPEEGSLFRAIAEMAERRSEILRRRRVGKGVWYALVDVTRWDDGVGTSISAYHERCEGKAAAIAAARRLLAAHADKFAEDITVEAEVLTDLEWQDRRRDFDLD